MDALVWELFRIWKKGEEIPANLKTLRKGP
jgi:hypothetical protein